MTKLEYDSKWRLALSSSYLAFAICMIIIDCNAVGLIINLLFAIVIFLVVLYHHCMPEDTTIEEANEIVKQNRFK